MGTDIAGIGGTPTSRNGPRWMVVAVASGCGLFVGGVIAVTEEWAGLVAWGACLAAATTIGVRQFIRARRRWPSPLTGLRIADQDRIRTAVSGSGDASELPRRLRPVALSFAAHLDHVRSACAPWYIIGLALYLGTTVVRAVVEPGWSTGLNLATGIFVLAGPVYYVWSWRRVRQVMAGDSLNEARHGDRPDGG